MRAEPAQPAIVPAAPASASKSAEAAQGTCDAADVCRFEVIDRGLLCLALEAQSEIGRVYLDERRQLNKQQVAAGDRPYVLLRSTPCLHASNGRNAKLSCEVQREGEEIVVKSRFTYDEVPADGMTEDCQRSTASCRLPKLEKGKHTLRFGDQRVVIEVPGPLQGTCVNRE